MKTMNSIMYPPPHHHHLPRQVICGVPEWFKLTWQSSAACVFFTCWQLAKTENYSGREEERSEKTDHPLWCCAVLWSTSLSGCPVERQKNTRPINQSQMCLDAWSHHDAWSQSWSPLCTTTPSHPKKKALRLFLSLFCSSAMHAHAVLNAEIRAKTPTSAHLDTHKHSSLLQSIGHSQGRKTQTWQ